MCVAVLPKPRQARGQCGCGVISTMNRDTRDPGRGTFVERLYAKDNIAELVFALMQQNRFVWRLQASRHLEILMFVSQSVCQSSGDL